MKKIIIQGLINNSNILLGEKIQNFTKYTASANQIIIITDSTVNKIYGKHFTQFPVIELKPGEATKSLLTINKIISKLIEFKADRNSFIVGIGGGVVCDITGFAASIFMRGVRFGYVSTTLLSQVDASIGGKNGVNFNGIKNIIGVFNQPEFVICDTDLLKTLPKRELLCGFSEIIKHALITDSKLVEFLEINSEKALLLDKKIIEHLIFESIKIKSEIIKNDEREHGERRKLNFGHTIGHAIEKNTRLNHGEAVAVGMSLAILFSNQLQLLSNENLIRAIELIEQYQLPTHINFQKEQIIDALIKDKKKDGDKINFVFLNDLGKCLVGKIQINEIEEFIKNLN